MKIKAIPNGMEKEQEFEVLPDNDKGYTHVLDDEFGLYMCGTESLGKGSIGLRLLSPKYVFGGVVFEETGERREPKANEWFCGGEGACPIFTNNSEYNGTYTILRHVCQPES